MDSWGFILARYIVYLILIKVSQELCQCLLSSYPTRNLQQSLVALPICLKFNTTHILLAAYCLWMFTYLPQSIVENDFFSLFLAHGILKIFQKDTEKSTEKEVKSRTVSYGVGMACSFFEGYLTQIIPNDGHTYGGLVENVTRLEDSQGISIPLKKLFLVITKSLFCPPELTHFNKENRSDLPKLELCRSLEDVTKNVGGVKDRIYRNSVYKITRPGKLPVHLVAEFATPLLTLHKVLERRTLAEKLSDVSKEEILSDFCGTLEWILHKIPEYRGKCVLVHYDDQDENENLSDVLLKKIEEIESNFEEVIRSGHEARKVHRYLIDN